ncbi:hypothetical protein ABZ372_51110 [Streptomyces sp. NPDC005921]
MRSLRSGRSEAVRGGQGAKARATARLSFDVSAFAGQTVTVAFTGTEDSSLQSSFVLDDLALDTSAATTPGDTTRTPA